MNSGNRTRQSDPAASVLDAWRDGLRGGVIFLLSPVLLPALLIVVLWWRLDDWLAGDGFEVRKNDRGFYQRRQTTMRRVKDGGTSLAA